MANPVLPKESDFQKLARKGNVIPVVREILADGETPVSAHQKLSRGKYSFLLESVEGGEKWARYSFLGTEPKAVLRYFEGTLTIVRSDGKKKKIRSENPFNALRNFLKSYRPVSIPDLPPFWGGLIGSLSYDCVRYIERLPEIHPVEDEVVLFLLADTVVVFDNLRHTVKIIANAFLPAKVTKKECRRIYRDAVARIDKTLNRLKRPSRLQPHLELGLSKKRRPRWRSMTSRAEYERSVRRAKRYIQAGDVIQVVLSQRMELPYRRDSFDLYRSLRFVNPSPYMFYLRLGSKVLIGSSPEILVRLDGRDAMVRPIAGTRPRQKDPVKDRLLEEDLKQDEKERAEHLMLVDLGRNDLGRVCEIGSVKLTDFMTVERYSHVMHLVSNVVGKLARGRDAIDLLQATFPAGTVTGAPKIRAMEIIEELEPISRGPYAGAVGYFSFSGNIDLCIAIRTMWIEKEKLYLQAGAGIVADSKPRKEYEETRNKAGALLQAVTLLEK